MRSKAGGTKNLWVDGLIRNPFMSLTGSLKAPHCLAKRPTRTPRHPFNIHLDELNDESGKTPSLQNILKKQSSLRGHEMHIIHFRIHLGYPNQSATCLKPEHQNTSSMAGHGSHHESVPFNLLHVHAWNKNTNCISMAGKVNRVIFPP